MEMGLTGAALGGIMPHGRPAAGKPRPAPGFGWVYDLLMGATVEQGGTVMFIRRPPRHYRP